jgi:three-Cys-motif partner protein
VSDEHATSDESDVEHPFGGPWTEIKLEAVMYYLECFTRALTAAGLDLWYIDAFAGTGQRQASRETGGLLEGTPVEVIVETLAGSARRALEVRPPFQHFVFMEKDPARCQALERLRPLAAGRDFQVRQVDANTGLREIVERPPWSSKGRSRSRGVVFLDPYALQVEWPTLQALASTKALDVWYLFPLRDVTRQLAHARSRVGPKARRLDKVLSTAWTELYAPPDPDTPEQQDLWGEPEAPDEKRVASSAQIEAWFKKQLDREFEYVSDPVPILTRPNRQTFSLFLGVSNPSPRARDLAKQFVKYARKQAEPMASRRRSGP